MHWSNRECNVKVKLYKAASGIDTLKEGKEREGKLTVYRGNTGQTIGRWDGWQNTQRRKHEKTNLNGCMSE